MAEDTIEPAPHARELFATGLAGHTAMCCDGEGDVLATNYRHLGSVGRISTSDGALILFDAPQVASEEMEQAPLVGIALDDDQRILTLDSQHGRVLRYNPESKMVSTLADRYQGRRFDSLFAIDIGPGGNIYFSEPERVTGDANTGSIYRFDVATNRAMLIADGLDQPTGICINSSGKSLYVAEAGKACITVYGLKSDDTFEKNTTHSLTSLLEVADPKEIGRLGHIALDRRAWLYVSLWDRGEVAVIDTNKGELLDIIPCGSDRVFGLAIWQDALLMSIPGKEAIYRYDLRPLIGRHAP